MSRQTILIIICIIVVIAGGSYIYWKKSMTEEQSVGLANPASVFCENNINGEVMMFESEEGVTGYCLTPDDILCEEWALFSSDGEACVPPGEDEFPVSPNR